MHSKFTYSALLALFCLGTLSANRANAQMWEKVPGLNPYIYNIYLPDEEPGKMVISSNADSIDVLEVTMRIPPTGNGCQISSDSAKTFPDSILYGFPVFDIMKSTLTTNHWMAAVRKITRGGILHSVDGGKTWNDFLSCDGVPQILKITSSVQDGKEYFGAALVNTSSGYNYSDDGFTTSSSNNGLSIQSRYIAYSKADPKLLFIAGDNVSLGKVYRSIDNGTNWIKESTGLEGLRVLCVLPDNKDANLVYCGADSVLSDQSSIGKGIYRSTNGGNAWVRVGAFGAQVFEIAQHPTNPKLLAAACGTMGVYISGNNGLWWEANKEGLPVGKSVRKIAIPNWDYTADGIMHFAGVFGDGLYKSKRIIAGIEDEKNEVNLLNISSVAPLPASNKADVNWNSPIDGLANINIYDAYGKPVFSATGIQANAGTNYFAWNCAPMVNGAYFVVIELGGFTANAKVVVNK